MEQMGNSALSLNGTCNFDAVYVEPPGRHAFKLTASRNCGPTNKFARIVYKFASITVARRESGDCTKLPMVSNSLKLGMRQIKV